MPEQLFRYVRCERAAAWEAAGWSVISGPLEQHARPYVFGHADASIAYGQRDKIPRRPASLQATNILRKKSK